jgi:hypothetical protein
VQQARQPASAASGQCDAAVVLPADRMNGGLLTPHDLIRYIMAESFSVPSKSISILRKLTKPAMSFPDFFNGGENLLSPLELLRPAR